MQELQLTIGSYGHMLNSIQVFSPDDEWVVYDTRNDQTHIARTCCIEAVSIKTGETRKIYSAPKQTVDGPGVGAPAWHPRENKIIFIHGLLNCDESRPYSFTRRFGAVWDENTAGEIVSAEARRIDPPLIAGALRGGTHAHSWSGDGEWISFTYNDFLMEKLERESGGAVKDLRTIGVMSPAKQVDVQNATPENFSGTYFTAVAATVHDSPKPGSDQVERAFDECWIGRDGYIRSDGKRQKRAIAFQGNIRTSSGSLVTEVFVADIPEDITTPGEEPLQGSLTTRPAVPRDLSQRRLTFTDDRPFPGIQGPRFWLRSSPDGAEIYFLMKDEDSTVQVWSVPVTGGAMRQVTRLEFSVQAQFNVSPDGKSIALIADNSVWVCNISTGEAQRLTDRTDDDRAPLSAVVWNNASNRLVYNRFVEDLSGRWLQIFTLKLN